MSYRISNFTRYSSLVIERRRIDHACAKLQDIVYDRIRAFAMLDRPAGARAMQKAREFGAVQPMVPGHSFEIEIPNSGGETVKVECFK